LPVSETILLYSALFCSTIAVNGAKIIILLFGLCFAKSFKNAVVFPVPVSAVNIAFVFASA
jgi:hypothetical protein